MKVNYHLSTIMISNSQMETQVSYSSSTKVNVTCLFLILNLKDSSALKSLASHFDIIESWVLIVGHRDIYYAKKNLNTFVCVEVWFLVLKLNVYEGHIFPRILLQTCRMETASLCIITRLLLKRNFQILIIIIEIHINVCVLFAHHVMTSIILHTRRANCQ